MKNKRLSKLFVCWIMIFTLMILSGSSVAFATESTSSDAPTYDVTIKIVPESGWLVSTTKVNVKVVDNKNTGTFQLQKLEAKIGSNGSWQDITSDGYIEVAENCTVYVQATDSYGTVYSQMRYLDGYDTTPPTFNAAVNNGVLTIEASDTESGVDSIYINGYKFSPNSKGKLTVRLQKFDSTYANFSIYVTDNSGNESEAFIIENPYYKTESEDDDEDDTTNPSDSLPTDATANETGESSATITSVTDENGDDISDVVDGKQFYSVVTSNGQQFYIVIDMTGEYFEGSTDTTGGSGTVYFLTNISNNDLLNVTSDDEVTLPYNSTAAANGIDDETVSHNETASTEESTEAEEKETEEDSSSDMILYIVIGAVAFAVIIVVMRIKKSGKSKTDIIGEEDEDDEDENDEEEDGVELTEENMEQFTVDSTENEEQQEHE